MDKPRKQKTMAVARAVADRDKHESLSQAATYALLMDSKEVADFLHSKLVAKNILVNRLVRMQVESGGTLFPGVPARGGAITFMAIEELARMQPELHPILEEIAQLEKLKYLAGTDNDGSAN
jgi:hypothetical protein